MNLLKQENFWKKRKNKMDIQIKIHFFGTTLPGIILMKPTKNKKIPDLSPHAYSMSFKVIPDEIKKQIASIKKRYNYKGDLAYFLSTLPTWLNSYRDLRRQRGRLKEQKTLYLKTIAAAKELLTCLESFSVDMRSKLIDRMQIIHRASAFTDIEGNLPFLIDTSDHVLKNLPQDKGGQVNSSLSQDLIWHIIQDYEFNVGKEAACGWDDGNSGEFVGEFYQYILELDPILVKLGINLVANRSIGQYTRELLTSRNKKRKAAFALIQGLITYPDIILIIPPKMIHYLIFKSIETLHFLKSPACPMTNNNGTPIFLQQVPLL